MVLCVLNLGANVVKVERPGGDNARAIVPDMVESINRGKRSICIGIAAIEDPFFARLVAALGLTALQGPGLARHHDRVAHRARIDAAIANCLRTQPLAHWAALFDAEDLPCAPVNSLDDVLADPHFQARGMVSQVDGQPRLRFPVPL
jgi:crotonobetainyl-CoA:carnitine CoA-transferase CaiB-like acyl-CoA transferase